MFAEISIFFAIGDNCLQREGKHCWDKIISMMLSDVSFSDTRIVKIVSKLSFLYIAIQYIVATFSHASQNRKIAFCFRVNLCLAMLSDCGLVIFLFLVCFLCHVTSKMCTNNQLFACYQRDFKNKIMKNVSAFVLLWSRVTLSFIL